jgi:hypothetical protein
MALEARCPGCQKTLQAPERALGRKVKCPSCGKSFQLRLSGSAEISPGRICPNCAAQVSFEDPECPACHVLLGTVTATAESDDDIAQREQRVDRFYRRFLGDARDFWKENPAVSIRLASFCVAFTALCLAFLVAALWSVKPLERSICAICGGIAVLVPLGLAWNLNVAVVGAALRNKKKLNKYRFDLLAGVGGGFKLIAWFLVVAAPAHLLVLLTISLSLSAVPHLLPVAAGLEAAAFVFASLVFPIASAQMATAKGAGAWRLRTMWVPLRRTLPALLRWCGCFYMSLAAALVCLGLVAVFCGREVAQLIQASQENSQIYVAQKVAADAGELSLPAAMQLAAGGREIAMPWRSLVLPAALILVAAVAFGGVAVFPMRVNGLYAHCFLDRLDLKLEPSDKSYASARKSLDEIVAPRRPGWNKVVIGLAAALATGTVIGGTSGLLAGNGLLGSAAIGLWLAGIVLSIGSSCWLLLEAWEGSDLWHAFRYAVLLVPILVVGGAFLFYGQMTSGFWVGRHGHVLGNRLLFVFSSWLAATLGLLAGLVYGFMNWERLKYLTVLMLGGYVGALVGAALYAAIASS